MRRPYLAAIAVAAVFSAFSAPAAAELRFRPCGPDRCARLSVRIPSALYGAYAGETGGGSTRAGVVVALFRR